MPRLDASFLGQHIANARGTLNARASRSFMLSNGSRLYLALGFSKTVDQQLVAGNSQFGVSYDDADTFSGQTVGLDSQIVQWEGRFTSTQLAVVTVATVPPIIWGLTVDRTNPAWVSRSASLAETLKLQAGMTTTVLDTLDLSTVSGAGTDQKGISFAENLGYTYVCFDSADKIVALAGRFSSTIARSLGPSILALANANGISWDGQNPLVLNFNSITGKMDLNKFDAWSSTILDSLTDLFGLIASPSNPRLEHASWYDRTRNDIGD